MQCETCHQTVTSCRCDACGAYVCHQCAPQHSGVILHSDYCDRCGGPGATVDTGSSFVCVLCAAPCERSAADFAGCRGNLARTV